MPLFRRQLHALSRDPATLTRAVLLILGLSVLGALITGWAGSKQERAAHWREAAENAGGNGGEGQLEELLRADPVDRAGLLRTLRAQALRESKKPERGLGGQPEFPPDLPKMPVLRKDLSVLLKNSKLPAEEQDLFLRYAETLKADRPDAEAAAAELGAGKIAGSSALPLTMAADVLRAGRDFSGALKLYEEAGTLAEGAEARRRAVDLAIIRDWPEVVERLLREESYRAAVGAVDDELPRQVAEFTGDAGALLGIAMDYVGQGMSHTGLFLLSLLAVAVWFVSLHKACRIPPRQWWIGLLGILLGVCSVGITLLFLLLQESRGGLTENGLAGNDFVFYLAGVGLREEGAKLICFLPLLPLLRGKSPGLALVAASCVGLGFALEENLSYYHRSGAEASLARFVTANFMHLGMSGLLGYSLFRFLRYPKNYGNAFLATFAAVVAFHGFYDFCLSGYSSELSELPSFMLAGLGWFYFQTLRSEQEGAPQALSAHAVFLLGSALLTGCLLNYLVADVGWHPAMLVLWPALISIVMVNALFVWFLKDF